MPKIGITENRKQGYLDLMYNWHLGSSMHLSSQLFYNLVNEEPLAL
jgi:hypothetical protein